MKRLLFPTLLIWIKSEIGFTALMLATGNRRTETVKPLIAGGTNLNPKDANGNAVLKHAEAGTHPDAQLVLQILRSSGAR